MSDSNIKKKVIHGTFFVVLGYGGSQVLRLGGNLILTRLLAPEMFGLMALANIFIIGLNLFSDIGLGPGIIRSRRADDPRFLNTAWTIQVIRGALLWFAVLVISYPVSRFYDNPFLLNILPVIGLVLFVGGFNSTSLYTLTKDIKLGTLTILDFIVQLTGLATMVILAYFYHSVWSLVIGGLVAAIVKTVFSHYLESNVTNRFFYEKEAARELFGFGKWIFFSTAMMFLATQADRILLGKFLTLSLFGIYGIAAMISNLPKEIMSKLSTKVIFPLVSQFSHLSRADLREKVLQKRHQLLIALMLLVALLTCFGDVIITLLYDERYHQAGWILPILALGMWPLLLVVTIDPCLYVVGKPKYPALGNLVKFIYMIVCLPVSFIYFGTIGAVVVVALNDFPGYVVVNYGLYREQLSGIKQDIIMTLALIVVICLLLFFRINLLKLGFPGVALFRP